jgi:hypothetical protein
MAEQFKCPRCGFEQPPTEDCRKCRINIPKYIELQKRRRAVPNRARGSQPPHDEEVQRSKVTPSEGTQAPSTDSDQPPKGETVPPKTPERIPQGPEEIKTKKDLLRIEELFDRSWEIFKNRIGTLILLYLLSIVFMIVPFGIFFGIGYLFSIAFPYSKTALIASGAFVGIIGGLIGAFWGFAAFIFAVVDKSLGIKDALEKGWQRFGAFIWLFSLLGYIITGGFLLFIIPGIIFSVWFIFAQFILANEDKKGMDALLKSKEYVRGFGFDIFLRLFIIWLISLGMSIIPFIGSILSILFMPFMMIFIYMIYEDLRSVKGDVVYSSSSGEKFKWIGVGTLGYVIVPIIIITLMGTYLATSLFLLKSILRYQ